tara:strand:+ start:10680 stop:11093 length:414 start_codon:yes stop_codon:yes gene_type:complete
MRFKFLAKLFFWLLIIGNSLASAVPFSAYQGMEQSYFSMAVNTASTVATFFAVIALYGIGYERKIFTGSKLKLIGCSYLASSICLIFAPVIIYWEQEANITIDIIVFTLTDLIIFYVIMENSKWNLKVPDRDASLPS